MNITYEDIREKPKSDLAIALAPGCLQDYIVSYVDSDYPKNKGLKDSGKSLTETDANTTRKSFYEVLFSVANKNSPTLNFNMQLNTVDGMDIRLCANNIDGKDISWKCLEATGQLTWNICSRLLAIVR